jgi:putative flippase GtrA
MQSHGRIALIQKQENNKMELPLELQVALAGLVAMVVTEGIKALFQKEVPELAKVVSAGVMTVLLGFSTYLLSLVPVELRETVSAVFAVVVSLLSAFGLHRMYKALRNK